MNVSALYDKVVAARLQNALLIETALGKLIKRLAQGADEELRKEYEWYAQQAKALATKDLVAIGKRCEETQDEFAGFQDD